MRHRLHAPAAALAMAAVLVLSGCSDNPTEPQNDLTAQDADMMAGQLAASLASGNGGAMVEIEVARERAVSGAASGGFPAAAAETTFTSGSLTYSLAITFFDAGGVELPWYDSTAVRMVLESRASGSFSSPEYSAVLGHSALHDVTGIEPASDRLTFHGESRDTVDADFTDESSGVLSFDWLSAGDWEAVVALKDAAANPYLLSGRLLWSAVVDIVGIRDGKQATAHYEVSAIVTFNGTRYPEIVIDGTHHYVADLETGAVQRV